MKLKCKCGKMATWYYMPGENNWACCDNCVPRGCTYCQILQGLDEEGRQLPCIEWWYNEEGWDDEN